MGEPATQVVVIDDHPKVVRGLQALFAGRPDMALTATADSSASGPAAYREHRPDLVLIARNLPDGDGFATTRRLRQEGCQRVLVFSMHDNEESLFAALSAGAHRYVQKGPSHHGIERAVRVVAAGDAFFGRGVAPRILQQLGARAPELPAR